ncbi:MAG TPA: DnaJ domain-containing protein [Kofleriaceae bacterium]|nr:DnaJ domain-containing protein [Kofleriaceae bacterium]
MNLDFDPNVDYYKALGVSQTATLDEIKKAYRKLAKQYHPDSTGGDKAKEARFKEIGAAYDVLGDAQKRRQYDDVRAMGGSRVRTTGGAGFPGGFGFGGGGPGGAGPGQVWDLGDLFAQMFSGGAAGGQPGRRSVRFERGDDDDGWVFESRQGGRGGGSASEDAFESKTQASDGSWLVVKGKDVHSDVRIPFGDAILGTVAEVATLDGKASVKIPPGTSSGRKLRLRGKGAVAGGGAPGDHYVTVQIDVPAQLDEKGKKLLHDLTQHLQAATRRK